MAQGILNLFTVPVVLAIAAGTLIAGPIDPPSGPVTSTFKTLSEVEPRTAISAANTPGDANSLFKITLPGSYYLTGNITGVVGKHGIEIGVGGSGVTLDLNGFDLAGVPAMGSFNGVSVSASNLKNITILNGSLRNWGGYGIDLGSNTFNAVGCSIERIQASGNGLAGFHFTDATTISDCSAYNNASSGFSGSFADGSIVVRCSSSSNLGSGFEVSSGCVVTDCTATNNENVGLSLSTGCTITGCTSRDNTGSGISTSVGCSIVGCTLSSNGAYGILTGGSTISGCTVRGSGLNGIDANNSSNVLNCTVTSNGGHGIRALAGSTVTGCHVSGSGQDGINCASACSILNNTCDANGTATATGGGVHVTGGDNHIEGNRCSNADRGILVDAAGNVIVKNTCATNTVDWIIAVNNIYGPVVDRRVPASVFVNGFAAPSTLGSTDPNANFSY